MNFRQHDNDCHNRSCQETQLDKHKYHNGEIWHNKHINHKRNLNQYQTRK